MTVPDEAVEAAALALHIFGKVNVPQARERARAALEAAAPLIAARAWQEGWNAGAGWPQEDRNPYYRSKP